VVSVWGLMIRVEAAFCGRRGGRELKPEGRGGVGWTRQGASQPAGVVCGAPRGCPGGAPRQAGRQAEGGVRAEGKNSTKAATGDGPTPGPARQGTGAKSGRKNKGGKPGHGRRAERSSLCGQYCVECGLCAHWSARPGTSRGGSGQGAEARVGRGGGRALAGRGLALPLCYTYPMPGGPSRVPPLSCACDRDTPWHRRKPLMIRTLAYAAYSGRTTPLAPIVRTAGSPVPHDVQIEADPLLWRPATRTCIPCAANGGEPLS